MIWDKESITKRLIEIKNKGYLSISPEMFRIDDGIPGQILEREFQVKENNLCVADLGIFELKGMRNRKSKSNMTLFHKKPSRGLSVIQIFNRFGYIKKSNRSDELKRKLFTTIKGTRYNKLGLILRVINDVEIGLYYYEEFISAWDLRSEKINQMVFALANTEGTTGSSEEKFHFTEAYLMYDINDIIPLIREGIVVIDLCIDQPLNSKKSPHDRGPHIRISTKKLTRLYNKIEQLI